MTSIHLRPIEELADLKSKGINPQIRISDRATICFPFHRLQDAWEEDRLGAKAYGSTRRGIAPAYGDRTVKKGIQIGELLYPERLKQRLADVMEWKELQSGLYNKNGALCFEETLAWVEKYSAVVRDLICDTTVLLDEAAKSGKNILFEAQLGTLRDLNFGIYPFTASSCALAAYAPVGGGLFGHNLDRVLAVVKAFSTCVGEGPFVFFNGADGAAYWNATTCVPVVDGGAGVGEACAVIGGAFSGVDDCADGAWC